mgnify:CR=1 FL=1
MRWCKPKYFVPKKLPRIPLESEIDIIIANASKKLGLALSISKDTGLRPIEVMKLKLRDIDLQNGLIYPETAKHGCARVLKIKNRTLNLLKQYISSRKIGLNDKLFGSWTSETYGKRFRYVRNKVAKKTWRPLHQKNQTLRFKTLLRYDALPQN